MQTQTHLCHPQPKRKDNTVNLSLVWARIDLLHRFFLLDELETDLWAPEKQIRDYARHYSIII